MKRVLYIVGAGLTKSLERLPQRIPLMEDFVSVMADHLDDDVILTHLAEMENADLFESPSPEAKRITPDLASGTNRSPAARLKLKEILKNRPAENIEVLLDKSQKKGGGDAAPTRFNFAINRFFCRIGWNLDVKPLLRFLRKQFRIRNASHTFISFNYDLTLDRCVQVASKGRWRVQRGYGFPIRHYIKPAEGSNHMKQFQSDGAFSVLEATEMDDAEEECTITILKPHGSLNFIFPFEDNYNFKDGPAITVLTENDSIDYYAGFDLQHVSLPGSMPESNRGLYLVPPTSAKGSALASIRAVREKEREELQSSDEIYVIGWSMPATDEDQQQFIKEAMEGRSKPIDRLVLVNYGATPDYFDRLSKAFQVTKDRIEIFNSGFAEFVGRNSPKQSVAIKWVMLGLAIIVAWTIWCERSRRPH